MAENENAPEEKESDQFNSMLSAAQKQVGAQGGSSSLSQAQIEAMLSGDEFDTDDDSSDAPKDTQETAATKEAPAEVDEDTAIADRFREGISADSQAAADETEKKAKKKKEKKPKETKPKEKKPLDKAALSKILTAAAVVVAAALGYCICLLFFTDVIKTPNQEFSIKAANAVNSKLASGMEMYVYKAYVRNGASADECMLYAIISSNVNVDSEKMDMYRVVVNHSEPNKINVYYTLDTNNPEYLKMLSSDDDKQRIKASELKKYSDEIAASDKEIQINSPAWEKINCYSINKSILEGKK